MEMKIQIEYPSLYGTSTSLILPFVHRTKTDKNNNILKYRIAQLFGGVKLWRIDRFRVLVGENVGEFTIANIATLVNLEFGGVKYWRMVLGSPNPPIFSSDK